MEGLQETLVALLGDLEFGLEYIARYSDKPVPNSQGTKMVSGGHIVESPGGVKLRMEGRYQGLVFKS